MISCDGPAALVYHLEMLLGLDADGMSRDNHTSAEPDKIAIDDLVLRHLSTS